GLPRQMLRRPAVGVPVPDERAGCGRAVRLRHFGCVAGTAAVFVLRPGSGGRDLLVPNPLRRRGTCMKRKRILRWVAAACLLVLAVCTGVSYFVYDALLPRVEVYDFLVRDTPDPNDYGAEWWVPES